MEAKSAERLTVINPFDESVVTTDLHVASEQDIEEAVLAAQAAFTAGPWSSFTGSQRAACLNKFADLLEKNAEELAYLDAICMGMPLGINISFVIPTAASVFRCAYMLSVLA